MLEIYNFVILHYKEINMKKKVSILEIVATKIVIALLVAGYYWCGVDPIGCPNIANIQLTLADSYSLYC